MLIMTAMLAEFNRFRIGNGRSAMNGLDLRRHTLPFGLQELCSDIGPDLIRTEIRCFCFLTKNMRML